MNNLEYTAFLAQLRALATIVVDMDIDGFLERVEQADSFGPILAPTAWRAGQGHLSRAQELGEGLRIFQTAVRKGRKNQ